MARPSGLGASNPVVAADLEPPARIGAPALAVPVTEQAPVLENILNVLRRRKRWILPALVLVPLLAAVLTMRQPDEYTATSNILFRDAAADLLSQDTPFRDPAVVKATNESLIELPVVSERTAKVLQADPRAREAAGGRFTIKMVEDAIAIESVGQSDLADITATTTDPFLSARMANVYGEEFIAFRQRSDQRQLEFALQKARDGLAALPPEQRNGEAAASYQERINRLETTQSLLTGNAELVQRSKVPTAPSGPNLKLNVLIGLVLGGILGLTLAGLRERLDQSLRTDDELEDVYRLPVLARLPRSRKLDRLGTRSVDNAEAEAFRILRANLRYFNVDGGLHSILVSSPTSGDGKSTVARGLASTMASLGDSVVLVEADLHKPVSPTLGHAPAAGLTSVLSGGDLNEAIERVPVDGDERDLFVLPAGPVPPNPVELLESSRMKTLLVELESRFDTVVIDSPALSQVSDARPLVSLVSGVVVVTGLGHTTRPAATDFRKQLHLLDGHAFGVVANFAHSPRGGYYTYG